MNKDGGCPDSSPKTKYDPMKYPFLAADFFNDGGEHVKVDQKETHYPKEPEQCPAQTQTNSDCDYGSEPFYAECTL